MPDAATQTQPSQPAGPSAEIMRLLNAEDADRKSTVEAEQRELTPIIGEAQKALNQPRPQQPQLQAAPKAPNFQAEYQKNGQDFFAVSAMIAGIVGAFTRNHVTTALNAFGALNRGFQQGQVQAAKDAHDQWLDASNEVSQNNNALLAEYRNALEDRKLTVDELSAKMNLVALKYKDPLMVDAAAAKNVAMQAQLYERLYEANQKHQDVIDRMEQQWNEFLQKSKDQLDKAGLNTPEGLQRLAAWEKTAKPEDVQRVHELLSLTHPGLAVAQAKTDQRTTDIENLRSDAQDLYDMVAADPTLVGARGLGRRALQAVGGQTAGDKIHDQLATDFKQRLQTLQAQLARVLLNARYFSGPAQKAVQDLLPGLAAGDDPTKVQSGLNAVIRALTQQMGTSGQRSQSATDTSSMSDEDIKKALGIQ